MFDRATTPYMMIGLTIMVYIHCGIRAGQVYVFFDILLQTIGAEVALYTVDYTFSLYRSF